LQVRTNGEIEVALYGHTMTNWHSGYVNSFKKWRISGRLKRLGYFPLSYDEFALSYYYLFYSGYNTIFNGKEAKRGNLFIGVRPRLELGETSNNLNHIWEARGEKLLVVVFRFILNGTGYRLHPVSPYLFICLFAFLWTSTGKHKIAF